MSYKYVGIIKDKEYFAMWLFPFGFEIFMDHNMIFTLTLEPLSISLNFELNNSLFKD